MDDTPTADTAMAQGYLGRMLDILARLPEGTLQSRKVGNAVVEFWRKSPVSSLTEDQYLAIWDHLWLSLAKDPTDPPKSKNAVSYAINDPAGKLTEDLLKFLWPKNAKVGSGIPEHLSSRLKRIVQRTDHTAVDASSVIVASRAEVLHALAPEFTSQYVLPLLSWKANPNAGGYWSAYLWPARISPDLFKLIEADCVAALKAPEHFEDRTYETLCQLFLVASMEFRATEEAEVREILDVVGAKGLEHMSNFLRHRMLNSKEDAAGYWLQTVKPWIDKHWPRDAAKQTDHTKEDFAMISLYSGESFPNALNWLEDNGLLGRTQRASTILHALRNRDKNLHADFEDSSTLPERFPRQVLRLLWLTQPFQWDHGSAAKIIERLVTVDPAIVKSAEYKAVIESF